MVQKEVLKSSYVQLESLVTTKVSYYETAAITLRLKENNYTHRLEDRNELIKQIKRRKREEFKNNSAKLDISQN